MADFIDIKMPVWDDAPPKLARMFMAQWHINGAIQLLERHDDATNILMYLNDARDLLAHRIEEFWKYSQEPNGWGRMQQWAEDHCKIITITEAENE